MRIATIIVPLLIVSSLFAQNKESERISINFKIGPQYDINTGLGKTYGLSFRFYSPKVVYSLGYYYTNEVMLFGDKDPRETLNDFNLMLGRYLGDRFFRMEGQFGLSLLWGQNRVEKYDQNNYGYRYNTENFLSIGLPLEMGFKYMPFKFMSIGIDIHANLNFEKSFFNTFLSLEFGVVRNEIKSRTIDQ